MRHRDVGSFADSVAAAIGRVAGPAASVACVFPSMPESLTREFEGSAARTVAEHLAVSEASNRIPMLSHNDFTVVERVHSARAALSALDAAASESLAECPDSSDVVIIPVPLCVGPHFLV